MAWVNLIAALDPVAWANIVLQGALIGGLYALFAAGLSLMFGVMRLVNIAHGDLIVLAAYLALVVVWTLGIPPLAALVIVVPIMFALGYLLQRGLLNFTLGDDILPPLLVTFGLSVIIQNALLEGFSADSRRLQAGALETASLRITDQLSIGTLPAIVFGVNTRHVFALATAISMAVVSIAGVLMAIRTNFDPSIGPARLIYAFEAVVIGGLGSLWGTLAGGVVLGVAQSLGAALDPGWEILAGHLAFLVVLAVRPRGLFPRQAD
jgi:branched-chain amino acid transport system permease protein